MMQGLSQASEAEAELHKPTGVHLSLFACLINTCMTAYSGVQKKTV